MSHGFIKLNRSKDTLELVKHHTAFILLFIIAIRTKRDDSFSLYGIQKGEAFIGDCDTYKMTIRKYRTAKNILEKYGFATFKATNKGTTAKLTNYAVFDLNLQLEDNRGDKQPDTQATSKRQASGQKATTNKNNKNIRIKEIKNIKEKIYKKEKLLVSQKKSYSDYVKMTEAQYQNLVDELGLEITQRCIEELDNYIPNMTRKPYTDHYRAIKSWVIKKVKSESLNSIFNPERNKMLTFNTQRSLGALEEIRAEENEKQNLLQSPGAKNE